MTSTDTPPDFKVTVQPGDGLHVCVACFLLVAHVMHPCIRCGGVYNAGWLTYAAHRAGRTEPQRCPERRLAPGEVPA